MFRFVVALVAETHRLVDATTLLEDAGFRMETALTARQALEFMVRAWWIAEHGDEGVDAILWDHVESTRRLGDHARAYKVPLVSKERMLEVETSIRQSADEVGLTRPPIYDRWRVFEQVCPEGLYPEYRALSSWTHPGWMTASAFMVRDRDDVLLLEPVGMDTQALFVRLAVILVHAQRIVDDLTVDHPRADELGRLAALAEVAPRLS